MFPLSLYHIHLSSLYPYTISTNVLHIPVSDPTGFLHIPPSYRTLFSISEYDMFLSHLIIPLYSILLSHYRNGVSRCGIYCTISITWEKLKTEGEVDIFRAVRTVKTNRTQLVENVVSILLLLLL